MLHIIHIKCNLESYWKGECAHTYTFGFGLFFVIRHRETMTYSRRQNYRQS